MNCLEYVKDNITETQSIALDEILINKTFIRPKSILQKGDRIIFTHGFHVGFGKVSDYHEIITDECSDNEIFSRTLSVYDDRLKIAVISPKMKKGNKIFKPKKEKGENEECQN